MALVVARLTDQSPLTAPTYAFYVQSGILQQQLATEEFGTGDVVGEAFSFDALAARHNFTFASRAPATQPDATEPDA